MTTFLFVDFSYPAAVAYSEIEPVEGPVLRLKPVVAVTNGDDSVAKGLVDHNSKNNVYLGVSGTFAHGFIATLSAILISELGDKTFFIGEFFQL